MRAMKSIKRYPLPVTTEKEACALDGVGSFTARRMLRGLLPAASAATDGNDSRINDEENIEPSCRTSASASSRGASRKTNNNSSSSRVCGSSSASSSGGAGCRASFNSNNSSSNITSGLLRMNLRVDGSLRGNSVNNSRSIGSGGTMSLTSNFAALRGGDVAHGGDRGVQTPDVTPKRPTSRARREEVGGGGITAGGQLFSSKAPRVFSGHWEAWLLVDNRENEFMSMQVRGIRGR